MKQSKEELDKLIANAPRNEKGQPVISDEDFMDNVKDLPQGTRSDTGKYAKDKGYIDPLKKGEARTSEIACMGGTAAGKVNRERRKIAETIDIFLKMEDENGVTNQEKIVQAMGLKAMEGCVGAFEALRDTVGEKPSDQVSLDIMSDADRELIENLKKRIDEQLK